MEEPPETPQRTSDLAEPLGGLRRTSGLAEAREAVQFGAGAKPEDPRAASRRPGAKPRAPKKAALPGTGAHMRLALGVSCPRNIYIYIEFIGWR